MKGIKVAWWHGGTQVNPNKSVWSRTGRQINYNMRGVREHIVLCCYGYGTMLYVKLVNNNNNNNKIGNQMFNLISGISGNN